LSLLISCQIGKKRHTGIYHTLCHWLINDVLTQLVEAKVTFLLIGVSFLRD